MTPQEAFNVAATGLLRQGRKSMSKPVPYEVCAYRGENGCKCAIGFLIPDSEYNSTLMEGIRAVYIAWKVSTLLSLVENLGSSKERLSDVAFNFLRDLQNIHDQKPVAEWRASLAKFATKYNLSPSILETLP